MIRYNIADNTKKVLRSHDNSTGLSVFWGCPVILNSDNDLFYLQFSEVYSDGC